MLIKCYCDAVIQIKLAIVYSPYILAFSVFFYISLLYVLSAFSVVLCPAKNLGVRSAWHDLTAPYNLIINMAVVN